MSGWGVVATMAGAVALTTWAVTPGTLAAQDAGSAEDEEDERCVCVDVDEQVDVERVRRRVRRSLEDVQRARRHLQRVAEMRVAFGDRPRLGIEIRPEQPEDVDALGVRIDGVRPESPAADAGLQEGDVIVAVGGQRLSRPLEDPDAEESLDSDRSLPAQRLTAILSEHEPGDEVRIAYSRADEERTVEVELGSFEDLRELRGGPGFGPGDVGPRVRRFRVPDVPEAPDVRGVPEIALRRGVGPGLPGLPGGVTAGLRVETLGPELGAYFGTEEGVLILDVENDSPLGLEPGDVVSSIGDRAVEDARDFRRILRSYEEGEEVRFGVRRSDEEIAVAGTMP